MKKFVLLVSLILFVCSLAGQTAGDFRSKQSGNWTSTSTWETYSGSEWLDAGTTPNSSNGVITIRNGHTVTINSTLTIDQTVVDEGGTLTVDLSSSQSLTINNGTGDDLTVNGTLNLSGGLDNGGYGLTGTGKTVINGICNWNSGHITNTNFNISSDGVMNMEGSGECRINWDGVVNNAGIVNFAKTDVSFVMYYNGTFNNLDGGIFEATTNQSIYYRQDLSQYNVPVFNNAGIFRKKTGTGTTTIYKMNFNNTGSVDVQSGTLKFTSYVDGTHTGTFTVASGANILTDDNSDHDFNEGSVINGSGTFEITNGLLTMNGSTNGTVIGSDLTFKLSGNSRLNGDGKLSVNGTFEWTSTGNIEVENFIISQGGKLNISGDSQKTFRAYPGGTEKIDNYGTITWTGTGAIGGYGSINNKSSGVIDIQNNATLDASSGAWTVINDGLIKKSAGTGTSSFRANLTNNGTLQVDTGTLDLYTSTFNNYDDNSGHPRLNGGIYDLQGKFKFKASYDRPIEVNNAVIILDGSESGILLYNGSNALVNLAAITSDGSLTLRNSRDFSSGASTFDNYGTLDCGTNVFSNSGNFKNWDYAWLILGSPDGITSSGSSGNIQSSGTRTFDTVGKYHYNGTSAQVTGNGLPATVRQLNIENSAGVTLSSSVNASSDLILSEGALSTGSNTLTLGSSAESVGTLTYTNGKIIGNFKRWLAASTVDDVLFPMGTASHYRPVNLSYTSAPSTGGTLTAGFTASDPGSNGLPLSDGDYTVNTVSPDGYWSLSAADGLSGGTYDLDITAEGFGGVSDYSTLRVLKRADSESAWTLDGSHVAGTGSNSNPILHRTGLSGFSEFGVGSDVNDNSLPVTLSFFTAKEIKGTILLEWETSAEIENQGFVLSREEQGVRFEIRDGFETRPVDTEKTAGTGHARCVIAGFATDDALKGQGSTTETTQYSWVDKTVEPGMTYIYTLYDVDYEGRETRQAEVEVKVKAEGAIVADGYSLSPVYPNPFNASFTLPFTLTEPMQVTVALYTLTGQNVMTVVNRVFGTGTHYVTVDVNDLASSVYFVRTDFDNRSYLQKVMLLK